MSLPASAIHRPVTTIMVFIGIVLIGLVSFFHLTVDMMPEIDMPEVSVITTYEGVGPEEIETLLTEPIEEAVSKVQGVQKIESYSNEGRSRVQLQFAWGSSLEAAANDVRAAVERIRDDLPEDATAPVVFKFDLSSFPIMMVVLSGKMDPWRLRQLADETITYRLERVPGVAAVDIRGGDKREIQVELDATRLAAFGLTAADVIAAISRDNINLPAGDMREHGKEVIIRTLGEFREVAQIGEVIVAERDGRIIQINDLGAVRDGAEEPQNAVQVDGAPAIRLAVSKLSGANTVEVAERVRREIAAINGDYPNLELMIHFDSSQYIRDSISNVEQGIMFGALLALAVLFLFLRTLRATMTIGVSIPVAVIGTFGLMKIGHFTLNMISFGGLALGIGMIVDNAIVILENIQQHRERGLDRRAAALRGSSEVSTAIIASTITTVCIFVPVLFQEGFTGIFFKEMAYVVTFALICSLLAALTLVPVLASFSGRRPRALKKTEIRWLLALQNGYGRLLAAALRHRRLIYVLAVLLLAGSVMLFRFIGQELMPESDQGDIRVDAELPVGTPLEVSSRIAHQAAQTISSLTPEALAVLGVAGPSGSWSTSSTNNVSLRVKLAPLSERERSDKEIAAALRPALMRLPDFQPRIRSGEGFFLLRLMRGGGERLSVELRGYEMIPAARLAREVAERMRRVPGVTDVDIDRKEGNREATVLIDAEKAADLGLTVGKIGQELTTYVLGSAATHFRERGDEFRIFVRLREEDRRLTEQLDRLPLITGTGGSILLGDVARIERREGPVSIRRLNQERVVTVSGGFEGSDLGSVVEHVRESLADLTVPEGFTVFFGGEFEEQQKAFKQLLIGLLLAVALVYMVMASLFESLLHPLIMLLSVPFAMIGIVLTLLLTGTTLNMNSFLGAIVLVGVVVNNAIILVDYINLLRREGKMDLTAAVIEGGRRRLRPILMTMLTTSLALLPVALGLGEGGEMQSPLARVVIGGLLSSSLITLILIPCLYVSFETFMAKRRAARN